MISMEDVGHNMLYLHVAQQVRSLQVHAPIELSPTNDNLCWAEQKSFIWHWSKQNIAWITQVNHEGREAWHTAFNTYVSKRFKGTVWR